MSLLCLNAFSQELYDSLLYDLATKYPQEKIHMQLDKSYYSAGETIWFKAYLMSGSVPSKISNTLYAELINERGVILERKTMPLFQAGAASHFKLPDSITFSRLYMRAYTSWMLNFDSLAMYVKPVNVVLPRAVSQKRDTTTSYHLTFFPEGGDIIENVEGYIAFKANDNTGKPFIVSGIITDGQGKTVTTFKSIHNGRGYFSSVLQAGENYKATWTDPAGLRHETLLPAPKTTGVALKIQQGQGLLSFTVSRPERVTDDFKEYVLVAQMHQEIVYAAKINLTSKTRATAKIPTDSLPDGVLQITVFTKSQLPVAERVVFVNNHNYAFITDLHLVEKNIKRRGKNVLQVDVGGRLKSNLSVSVTDASLDSTAGSRENIFSQMLLTEDLKGYVYDPAYYFLSDEDSVKKQLDLVMMTNGWRRFNWEKLLKGQWPVIRFAPDNYLTITGTVFGISPARLKGQVLTGILQTSDKGSSTVISIPVNGDGSFKTDGLYFFDTVKLFYQFNNDKNKVLTNSASFKFNNTFVRFPSLDPQSLAKMNSPAIIPPDILLQSITQNDRMLALLKRENVKVLETVTLVSKQKSLAEKLDEEYATSMFSSMNARVFATDDDPFAKSSRNVFDYLRSRVPGLNATGGIGGNVTRRGNVVDLFLNEINTEPDMLETVSMADVVLIKVFDPPFLGSRGGGAGGAVAVYTRKGGSTVPGQGLNSTTVFGYSAIKEFYVPDYDNTALPVSADYRPTLYWNPFLVMDENNKRVTLPFFHNDNGKKIRVIIEGLNELGQLTREEKFFE